MKSRRNTRFNRAYDNLADPIKDLARTAYTRFRANPFDPRLSFHEIKGTKTPGVHAVDVGKHRNTAYRALGVWEKKEGFVVWFWIGSHEDYNNIIERL